MHFCSSPTLLLICWLIFLVCGPTTRHTGMAAPTWSPPLFSPRPGACFTLWQRVPGSAAQPRHWDGRLGGSERLAWIPMGSTYPGRSQYVFVSPTSHPSSLPPAWHKRTASYSPLFYILFYILKWCMCVWYPSGSSLISCWLIDILSMVLPCPNCSIPFPLFLLQYLPLLSLSAASLLS